MKTVYFSFALVGLCCATVVSATSVRTIETLTDPQTQLDRYKSVNTVEVGNIVVPQVVTIELPGLTRGSYVLTNKNNKQVAARIYSETYSQVLQTSTYQFSSVLGKPESRKVHYFDSREKVHQFMVSVTGGPIGVLEIDFAENTLPVSSISVEYLQEGQWVPLVSRVPQAESVPLGALPTEEGFTTQLRVTLESEHLVGIGGVEVFSDTRVDEPAVLAWYAEPNTTYVLYHEPSFGQSNNFYVQSEQSLDIDEATPRMVVSSRQDSQFYNDDFDGDGIEDARDLCPRNKDASNADIDNNGRGDVCEDKDQDGKIAGEDNCPVDYNPAQEDADADGLGDECDDSDDRTSESLPYLELILFGLLAGLLLWLVYRSVKK